MKRQDFIDLISKAFQTHPIVALLGPRQCGKTTLAKQYIAQDNHFNPTNYFDLENDQDLARLTEPLLALENLESLIVIDEIQRITDLFKSLRVLVDRDNNQQRYLILGSASRELIHQSSETLAGRIAYLELTPFNYEEVDGDINKLWERGGFPKSFLAANAEQSRFWRQNYIRTYLEQDIPNLGIRIPADNLRRFWQMLAHYHGNIFNASELGRSLNLTQRTINHYADILSGTFMIRQLKPWFENISKRQVKSPKIYFRDSGILHSLLYIEELSSLLSHPKLGSSWEGFALESIIRHHQADEENCYFWATHAHAELDLLIFQGNKRLGFEFKYTKAPKITPSMKIALTDLHLDALTVIYPGEHQFALSKEITACGLELYLKTEK